MMPKSLWTKEELIRVARTCATRKEFRECHSAAYWRCVKLGIVQEVCEHMPKRYEHHWTVEKVYECASNYDSKDLFHREQSGAYKYASRKGILADVCAHMTRSVNDPEQFVFVYRYADARYAYIGVAQDVKERRRTHLFTNSTTPKRAQELIKAVEPTVLHHKGVPLKLPRRVALVLEKGLIKVEKKECLNVRHNA